MENYILERLTEFTSLSPLNALTDFGKYKIYDTPIIGIADANDPIFDEFLRPDIVSPSFILPKQWLKGAKSIVSYFLPFTKEIRDSNRKEGIPSKEWELSRKDGENFNNAVRMYLIDLFKKMNEDAIAPCLDPRFKVVNNISNWSERHVAFAAGLGTFGLHRGLITEKGTAGRFGSVVTTLSLTPTERKYHNYYEYCLFLSQGKCGACIRRCPGGAITKKGKNINACIDYFIREVAPRYASPQGCAKCNIGVSCESRNPTK